MARICSVLLFLKLIRYILILVKPEKDKVQFELTRNRLVVLDGLISFMICDRKNKYIIVGSCYITETAEGTFTFWWGSRQGTYFV